MSVEDGYYDELYEVLRRVVMDYGDACQDETCSCSLGQARRQLGDKPWPGIHDAFYANCSGQHHGPGSPDCPKSLHHHHDEKCGRSSKASESHAERLTPPGEGEDKGKPSPSRENRSEAVALDPILKDVIGVIRRRCDERYFSSQQRVEVYRSLINQLTHVANRLDDHATFERLTINQIQEKINRA